MFIQFTQFASQNPIMIPILAGIAIGYYILISSK